MLCSTESAGESPAPPRGFPEGQSPHAWERWRGGRAFQRLVPKEGEKNRAWGRAEELQSPVTTTFLPRHPDLRADHPCHPGWEPPKGVEGPACCPTRPTRSTCLGEESPDRAQGPSFTGALASWGLQSLSCAAAPHTGHEQNGGSRVAGCRGQILPLSSRVWVEKGWPWGTGSGFLPGWERLG